MRLPGKKTLVLLMGLGSAAVSVNAQFSQEETMISHQFILTLTEQVNGYIILSDHDEHFLQWLIGLYDNHDENRARWQINNVLRKNKDLEKILPWEFSEKMNVYMTQLLMKGKFLFTVSFSEHLNGFVVLSHGELPPERDDIAGN